MFRYLTEVLADKLIQLPRLQEIEEDEEEAIRLSTPITMPLMASSVMQACCVMIMTLYKVKPTLMSQGVLGGAPRLHNDFDFPRTERLVEELRHGVEGSMDILEKYKHEFVNVQAMYKELHTVYKVAFAAI